MEHGVKSGALKQFEEKNKELNGLLGPGLSEAVILLCLILRVTCATTTSNYSLEITKLIGNL